MSVECTFATEMRRSLLSARKRVAVVTSGVIALLASLLSPMADIAGAQSGATVTPPFVLDFQSSSAGTIVDAAGNGTGFNSVLPSTGGVGHVPADLDLDTSAGGTLTISSGSGDRIGTANNLDNALAVEVQAPVAAFSATTTINNPPAGSFGYEQGGLWLGNGEDNYVKLVVISFPQGQRIELLAELGGQIVASAPFDAGALTGRIVDLRLDVDPSSGVVSGFFALDGGAWQQVGSTTVPAPVTSPALTGIFASHRNAPASVDMEFDRFEITAATPTTPSPTTSTDLSLSASASPATGLSVGDNVTVTATVTNESPAGSVIDLSSWPDASNTGVVAGTTLTPYTGPTVITTAGTTIQDADVSGCLEIAANNVTITNSRVTCGTGIGVWQYTGVNGLVMDRVELIGTGTGSAAVYGIGSYTLTNSHVRGFVDGLKVDNDDTIIGNYVHDLVQTANSHNDVIQSSGGSNTIIRGNRLEHIQSQTSGYILKADLAPISDYIIEENLLTGGSFNQYVAAGTMCCGGAFPEPTNMVVRNNVVMANSWIYGEVVAQGATQLGGSNIFECVVDENGVPLELYWRDLQTAGIGPAPCTSLIGITGVAGSVGTATGVVVSDVLPDGLQYVGHNGSGSYDPVADVWTPSIIAPASSQSITIFAQAPTASTFTSTPQITAIDQFDTDSTPANNAASEDDQTSLSLTVGGGHFPPTIAPGVGPFTTTVNSSVPLSGTATDPEGTVVTLSWDLDGDGTFESPNPASFSSATPGSFPVTFQACDSGTPVKCVTQATTVTVLGVGCGPLSQEAENGALTGAMVSAVDSSASGGAYLTTPELSGNDYFGGVSPSTAEYCMTVPAPGGNYTVDAMITGNGGTSDSVWVQVDGGPLLNWALASGGFAYDKAYNWGGTDPATFNLAAGDHTVKLFTREDGVFIDWLALVPVGQTGTPPTTPVPPTPSAPTVSANGPYLTTVGTPVPLAATAADVDGDLQTVAWDLDGDGTFESADPATFTPTAPGTVVVTVEACDALVCVTDSTTVTATVAPIPPTVSANGPYTTVAGTPVALAATAADANGDTLTVAWDLDGDGTFESADPASFSATTAGSFTVTVQACDASACVTDTATVTVTANTLPTVSANGPYTTVAGTPVGVAATAADADGDALTVNWDLDGDGTFEAADPASFPAATAGTFTVAVEVCDAVGCVTDTATITVTPPTPMNNLPTVSANGPYTTVAGTPVALAATAADADGDALTVNWDLDGDGTFEAADPASFPAATAGTTTVTVQACDAAGCVTDSTTVTVTAPPPTGPFGCGALSQEAESGTLAGVMAVAADGGASGGSVVGVPEGTKNDYSKAFLVDYVEFCMGVQVAGNYVIDTTVTGNGGTSDSFWVEVDGGTPLALWSVPSGGLAQDFVSVQGGADPLVLPLTVGDHTIRFYLREDGTELDTVALVQQGGPPPLPPMPMNNPPTGSANGPYSTTVNTAVTFTATASDPDGDPVTINWDLDADGTYEAADPATLTPTATGTQSVTVEICDNNGACITDTVTLTVNAAPPGPATPPPGCSATTTEAEAANIVGVFGIVTDGAASGGIAVEVPEGTKNDYSKAILADYVEFCLFAPVAGNYTIDSAATGAGNTSDSFWVSINGAPVVLWSIPSNGYTNDQVSEQGGADPVVWPLPVGPYTVRFYLREDGTRLDKAGLAPTTAAATAPTPPPAGPPTGPPTGPSNTAPTANAGGPYALSQGTSIVLNGAGGDADGDPLSLSWDLDNNGTYETPNPATFNGTTAGTFTVGLEVCDGTTCTTDTATITVSSSCGSLTQEAEDGILSGSMFAFNEGDASGLRAIRTPQGTPRDYVGGQSSSYAEYCITVPTSGLYRIDGQVRGPNGGSDSFWVQFNSGALALWDLGPSFTYKTDSVSNRGGPDPVIWNIPAGDHTLRFYMREDGARLDKFTLVAV